MKNKKNLLVTLADKNYVEQAKQLFSSVYWNAGWKGDYLLLSYKIPEKELEWFRKKGILIKKCKPVWSKDKSERLYRKYLGSKLNKFYLFTPEFKKWENIIFLDADIIVRASLSELTKVKGFGAVLDDPINNKLLDQFIHPAEIGKEAFNKFRKRYNINAEAFNSGVMAFNTRIINKDSFPKLKDLFMNYNNIIPPEIVDQPIFNLFFHKTWEKLPFVYNLDIGDFRFINPKKINAIIIHFRGRQCKSWFCSSPFHNEWKNNLKRAEAINLKKPLKPSKKWVQPKIKSYSRYLEIRSFLFFANLEHILKRILGLIGISLYINFPRLYFKLKKLKANNKI
jgi:lipopolysaccharide biosynthesis glycosyltransferase